MSLTPLYQKLGYHFKQPDLLKKALTHCSASVDNNERFEFLGDSILSMIMTDWLFQNLSTASEGELSRLRSVLVRGDMLSEIAKELDLGEFLLLGPGEMKSGGSHRESILADSFEALIAAIYLDEGLEACRSVILRLFQDRLNVEELLSSNKDPKSRLQEYLQAKKLPLPEYQVERIDGQEHQQRFYVTCCVDPLPHRSSGEGSSRRRAEQQAAENLYNLLMSHESV